jgi:UDP-4-amino-4,6-dideoxy-N-acetyl-beta-L-altrosamine transaminase
MMIPYGRQEVTEKDIEAVIKVLRSDYLTQGPAVPVFEERLCDYTGANHVVALNSCTSALHVACLALELGLGDILWTSPITFVASANCAHYCGASVDFVDIEPDTALMSVKKLEEKLIIAEKEGRLPKIVIPVHFAGQSCDMEVIHALSQKYGFRIIEDAAHAIGARYRGEPVGNCRYSDITVFSFHPVKIITTGEGGAALTNNIELANCMKLLRSHGITREQDKMKKISEGSWYYEQISLGFNYRMTDFQAALGISQLSRLNEYVAKRSEIASWYDNNFKTLPVNPLIQNKDVESSYHLYVVRIKNGKEERNKFYRHLRDNDIFVNLHYIPIYRQPYYQGYEFLENAEKYYQETVSLPIFPTIKQIDLSKIVKSIEAFFI